jgi:hypothetical protein
MADFCEWGDESYDSTEVWSYLTSSVTADFSKQTPYGEVIRQHTVWLFGMQPNNLYTRMEVATNMMEVRLWIAVHIQLSICWVICSLQSSIK